ncbi:MAG: hypothetical protein O3C40_20625, partial [Planctomycetota bacterium]|nr:hypothetical protein [Planctomycetota bacterium]
MNREEFETIVLADPKLAEPIRAAAGTTQRQYSVIAEAAVIALMFPVVKLLLTRIGLPWLAELGRYSELQRQRLHEWIDDKYREEDLDPEQAEAASDALIAHLGSTTDRTARSAWERLAALL